jgi:deoxyribodipyrimidine photo-lyase
VTGPLAGPDAPACIAEWAAARGLRQVVTPHAPVGPAAARLAEVERLLAARGIRLVCALRDWDAAAWLHATHGFFRFREAMPRLLAHLLPGDAA